MSEKNGAPKAWFPMCRNSRRLSPANVPAAVQVHWKHTACGTVKEMSCDLVLQSESSFYAPPHTFLQAPAMEANQETDNETLMNCIRNCREVYDKSSTDYKVPLKKIMLGRRFQKSWALRKLKSKQDIVISGRTFLNILKRGDH